MEPNDTNHTTLGIYFDYLEDNNHDTNKLRFFESKIHWEYEIIYGIYVGSMLGNYTVGVGDSSVGVAYWRLSVGGSYVGISFDIDTNGVIGVGNFCVGDVGET